MTNSELSLSQLATATGGRSRSWQLNPAISVKLHQARLSPPEALYRIPDWFKIPGDMYKPVTPESRGDMLSRRGLDPGPIG